MTANPVVYEVEEPLLDVKLSEYYMNHPDRLPAPGHLVITEWHDRTAVMTGTEGAAMVLGYLPARWDLVARLGHCEGVVTEACDGIEPTVVVRLTVRKA